MVRVSVSFNKNFDNYYHLLSGEAPLLRLGRLYIYFLGILRLPSLLCIFSGSSIINFICVLDMMQSHSGDASVPVVFVLARQLANSKEDMGIKVASASY